MGKNNTRFVRRIKRLFKENGNQPMSSQKIYELMLTQMQLNVPRTYSDNPSPHGLRNILAKDKSFRSLKENGRHSGIQSSNYKVVLFKLREQEEEE